MVVFKKRRGWVLAGLVLSGRRRQGKLWLSWRRFILWRRIRGRLLRGRRSRLRGRCRRRRRCRSRRFYRRLNGRRSWLLIWPRTGGGRGGAPVAGGRARGGVDRFCIVVKRTAAEGGSHEKEIVRLGRSNAGD